MLKSYSVRKVESRYNKGWKNGTGCTEPELVPIKDPLAQKFGARKAGGLGFFFPSDLRIRAHT